MAQQRHKIIPNRLALTAEESASGVTGATAQVNQETHRCMIGDQFVHPGKAVEVVAVELA